MGRLCSLQGRQFGAIFLLHQPTSLSANQPPSQGKECCFCCISQADYQPTSQVVYQPTSLPAKGKTAAFAASAKQAISQGNSCLMFGVFFLLHQSNLHQDVQGSVRPQCYLELPHKHINIFVSICCAKLYYLEQQLCDQTQNKVFFILSFSLFHVLC